MIHPEQLSDEDFYRWATTAPTQADVAAWETARLDDAKAKRQAEMLAAWKANHPEATCADATALLLAEMEQAFGRR